MPEVEKSPQKASELPWVKSLRGANRDAYDQARQENIEEILPIAWGIIEEVLPDLRVTDPEAFGALALGVATGMRNHVEGGIQIGFDIKDQEFQRERERFGSFQINALGGWG